MNYLLFELKMQQFPSNEINLHVIVNEKGDNRL